MAQRALDVLPSGAQQSCQDKGYVVTVAGCEEEVHPDCDKIQGAAHDCKNLLRLQASSTWVVTLAHHVDARKRLGVSTPLEELLQDVIAARSSRFPVPLHAPVTGFAHGQRSSMFVVDDLRE